MSRKIIKLIQSIPLPFSVYIHWPYCESKCTYCNFNKYTLPKEAPNKRLISAMEKEINYYIEQYELFKRPLHSIYFGGGTPSLAKPSELGYLIELLDKKVGLAPNVEVTMEANPTSIELKNLRDFKKVGINRLSLGIQSFDDKSLKHLGRDHSGIEGIRGIAQAKKTFENLTFDLIFGRPGQSLNSWENELKLGLDLAANHISLYQLTVEKSTPIQKALKKGDLPSVPNPDQVADMYEMAIDLTKEHGFRHYEVSNYSRSTTTMSQHNLSYWRGMDYIGIGPGAHGKITQNQKSIRTYGEFHPDKYMALCELEGEGIRKCVTITNDQFMEELVVFGLRTKMGISYNNFEYLTSGNSLDNIINKDILDMCIQSNLLIQEFDDSNQQHLQHFIPENFRWEWKKGGIRPTEEGLAKIDTIIPLLLNK
ncbi:unnamed protein product [Cunninghamella blakesleeana]